MSEIKNRIRALVLFSGGLDSILAVLLLKEQNIEVVGICFSTPFFDCQKGEDIAKELKIKLIKKDISSKFWSILKKPVYGYGRNMNPCLDCHLLMLKEAKKLMKKVKADFVATGEVLGERPFSQNKNALDILAHKSGLEDLLLRPLSAKLLPLTIPEKKGWVDREKLLAIAGRRRIIQINLAQKWKIKNYPTPASGCLLTDPGYSFRLKRLLKIRPSLNINDAQLIKYGRFFIKDKSLIIIGRNNEENLIIKKMALDSDIIMQAAKFKGPTTLIRNYNYKKINESIIKKSAQLTGGYGKGRNENLLEIIYYSPKRPNKINSIIVKPQKPKIIS